MERISLRLRLMSFDVIKKVFSRENAWFCEKRAVLRMMGEDRLRFLNGQVTNDVPKIRLQQAAYAATCTAKGKIVADLWISNEGDSLRLDTSPELGTILKERLEKYLIADDVEILEEGIQTVVHAVSSSGEEGVVQSARGGFEGYDDWNSKSPFPENEGLNEEEQKLIRILTLTPLWGKELTPEILPPEAGMDRNAIRYDKGCYVGQEVMARIKSIGHVNKQLLVLQSIDERVPREGEKLFYDGREVGWVTSASSHPSKGCGMALGYVAWKVAQRQEATLLQSEDLSLTICSEIA